jgi:hypothetical protein
MDVVDFSGELLENIPSCDNPITWGDKCVMVVMNDNSEYDIIQVNGCNDYSIVCSCIEITNAHKVAGLIADDWELFQ